MYEQPYDPFAKNVAIIKDYFKSGSVLAMAIIKSVCIILSLLLAIFGANAMIDFAIGALQASGASYDTVQPVFQLKSVAPLLSVMYCLPAVLFGILIALAYYIIYFKSRSASPQASPKAGFVILFIISVFNLISSIFISLFLLVIVVFLFAAASDPSVFASLGNLNELSDLGPNYDYDSLVRAGTGILTTVAVVFAVMMLIVIFVLLFYTISQVHFYNSLRKSVSSVELLDKGARPYGVMIVISAVCSGLSLLSLPTSFLSTGVLGFSVSGIEIALIFNALIQIASFAALIVEAKIVLGYKKYIDDIKYGYHTPTAPAGPYAPFPAGTNGYVPQSNPYMNGANNYGGAPVQNHPPYATGAQPVSGEPYTVGSQPDFESFSDETTQLDLADERESEVCDDPLSVAAAAVGKEKAAENKAGVCPSCGQATEDGAPFCGNCGTKLQ